MEKTPGNDPASSSQGENGGRLKFSSIVEAAEAAADSMPWREDPAAPAAAPIVAQERPRARRQRPRWSAWGRQMVQATRLAAILFFSSVVIGWPLGKMLAYRELNGGLDGYSPFDGLPIEAFMLATLVPILMVLIGYIMSRQMAMMDAAETIASAARQFMHPDDSARRNVESVGIVVREQMDAMNAGLDDALTRLATVEAMIRQHVEVIETAGVSIEARTSGAVTRIADERARLIDLTENLNQQADAFATAIAEKAQASIESLHSADDFTDRAQTLLEERLSRLENAAQQALVSFNALSEALYAADDSMRTNVQAIDNTAAETRAATERATKASEAAAESAARNAANVGAAAARAAEEARKAAEEAIEATSRNIANVGASAAKASEEAKKAADTAVEAASREAERASRAAYEAAEREAKRVSETASKILGDVKKSTDDLVARISKDTENAASAANKLSESAQKSAELAAKASGDVAKASAEAQKHAETALARAEESAQKIDERNRALAEARTALEAENHRLESLIEEQRKRADRLADAIATQTERLSKLAEAQIREQEASARLAEAQRIAREREEAEKASAARLAADQKAEEEKKTAELRATQQKAEAEATAAAEAARRQELAQKAEAERKAEADRKAAEETQSNVLDLDEAVQKDVAEAKPSRQRLDEMAEDIAQRRKPAATREEPTLDLTDGDKKPAKASRRDKHKVTWREILDATDDAEPLDLAAASTTKPEPGPDGAADAIKIISELQNFTFNLETRLYGEPPVSLRERFERGDRNVFANRLLRLNETDVKRRIRVESGRDKMFERDIHGFLQGFERLLEDATTSETADEDLEEYLSSPLGRVYLLIGATVGYFA